MHSPHAFPCIFPTTASPLPCAGQRRESGNHRATKLTCWTPGGLLCSESLLQHKDVIKTIWTEKMPRPGPHPGQVRSGSTKSTVSERRSFHPENFSLQHSFHRFINERLLAKQKPFSAICYSSRRCNDLYPQCFSTSTFYTSLPSLYQIQIQFHVRIWNWG